MNSSGITSAISLLLTAMFAAAQCPDYSEPGDFSADYVVIDEIPTEDETMDDSRVYYPAAGDTVSEEAAPCPIVVFGHGFMTSEDNYYSYAAHFATHGYVCIIPTFSNPFLFPNHNYRARLMITAGHYLVDLNETVVDIFHAKLDADCWAFAGHSMGGSISLLTADRYVNYPDSTYHLGDTLRAVIALGSPQSDPETVPEHITTPTMVLTGSEDGIAPWEDVRSAFWEGGSYAGVFAVIAGANHTYFTDVHGTYFTDGSATISREEQLAICRKHMTPFLNFHCRGDSSPCAIAYSYGDSIAESAEMDSAEIRGAPLEISERGEIPESISLLPHPNPFNSSVTLTLRGVGAGEARLGQVGIKIYDLSGRCVADLPAPSAGGYYKGAGGNSAEGPTPPVWNPSGDLPAGVYLAKVESAADFCVAKLIYIK